MPPAGRMKLRISCLLAATVLATTVLACGPIAFIPGIRIGGTETAVPSSWSEVAVPGEVLLRADGGVLPRVVTIWAVESGGSLYVAGVAGSGWVDRLVENPDTYVRIDDALYSLRASLVAPGDERSRVFQAYLDKYRAEMSEFNDGQGPDRDDPDRRVFRLEAR